MLATRNQIVEQLFTGKNFRDCISKMEPAHLQEDLKQDVICIVCEWPDEKVIKLHQENALEFYVVRVILNQAKSHSSPFHKRYRQVFYEIKENYVDASYINDFQTRGGESENKALQNIYDKKFKSTEQDDYENRLLKEQAEDLAMEEINRLYWYDAEMIRLYLKLGSFRAIEDHTGIPFISCYKNIKKSLGILKNKAEGVEVPLFTKEERSFIQNNKHARELSNTF